MLHALLSAACGDRSGDSELGAHGLQPGARPADSAGASVGQGADTPSETEPGQGEGDVEVDPASVSAPSESGGELPACVLRAPVPAEKVTVHEARFGELVAAAEKDLFVVGEAVA